MTSTVYLIHGLLCRPWIMRYLGYQLTRQGWHIQRWGYASRRLAFQTNVANLQHELAQSPAKEIALVGHSLGGLLALAAVVAQPDRRIQRIILLGTPLQGSVCGQRVTQYGLGKRLLGRNSVFWHNLPRVILPPQVEVGMIAGQHELWCSTGRLFNLSSPHDGIVTVAETHMAGLADHCLLPVSHTGLLFSKAVVSAIAHFLKQGKFADHPKD